MQRLYLIGYPNPAVNILCFKCLTGQAAIFLLEIQSGRRVHVLTLLRISNTYVFLKATLQPTFGSKTNASANRQSGWLVLKYSNQQVCPVTQIKRIIANSQVRRNKETRTGSFITINGNPHLASRTAIGGCIRSVLKEAEITAYVGSFRSAVTSVSWVEIHPIDEILSRGN